MAGITLYRELPDGSRIEAYADGAIVHVSSCEQCEDGRVAVQADVDHWIDGGSCEDCGGSGSVHDAKCDCADCMIIYEAQQGAVAVAR